jgi:hypothetical protein
MLLKMFKFVNLTKKILVLKRNNHAEILLKVNRLSSLTSQYDNVNPADNRGLLSIKIKNKTLFQSLNFESIYKQYSNLHEFKDFKLKDFEIIIKTLLIYQVFPQSLNEDSLVFDKLLSILTIGLFGSNGNGMAHHLLRNHQNWSIFSECFKVVQAINLKELGTIDQETLSLINKTSKHKLYKLKNFSLADFDFYLMKALNKLHDTELELFFSSLSIGEKVQENIYERLEMFCHLKDSMNKRFNDNIGKWENKEREIDFQVLSLEIQCNNLKVMAIKHKSFISQKMTSLRKTHLSDYNQKLKLLLAKYPNLDSSKAIKLFKFDEKKNDFFLNQTSSVLVEFFKSNDYLLKKGLEGAIYQNNLKYFQAITMKLFSKNCSNVTYSLNFKYDVLFKQFLILRARENPDETITSLLNAWNSFHYIPYENAINDLKNFISQFKFDIPWQVSHVNISINGHTENNLKMPTVKYLKKDLNMFADYIKNERVKDNKNTRELFVNAILYADEIFKKCKFDVVLDGLNVGFSSTKEFSYNFEKLIPSLDLSKKYLITMRPFFYKTHKKYFDRLKERLDYEFFFMDRMLDDDIIVIYSALRNDAYIITNDDFTNHITFLGKYSYLFKNWIKSRIIKYDKKIYNLVHPPNFYHFTQQIDQNHWIVPYYSKEKVMDSKSCFDLPDCFVCVQKNK